MTFVCSRMEAMHYDYLLEELSQRELECFCLIIYGKTGRQISEILDISVRTVEEYLKNLKRKLQVQTLNEIIVKAVEYNCVKMHPQIERLAQSLGIAD